MDLSEVGSEFVDQPILSMKTLEESIEEELCSHIDKLKLRSLDFESKA